MIVDTSAIIAILLDEPERDAFIDRITDAEICRVSSGSLVEIAAVITRRKLCSDEDVEQLLRLGRAVIEPVTSAQARIGYAAYRTYGIGSGHAARLNFGDCFAYALAKATGEPLLFKGDDFLHTDVEPAWVAEA